MRKFVIVSVVVISVSIGAFFLFKAHTGATPDTAASQPKAVSANTASTQATTSTVDTKAVQSQLQSIIDTYSALEIGVSAVNLSNGATIQAGEANVAFKGASTIKVLTALCFMHEVEEGETSLSTLIDDTDAQTLLRRMLQKSDNAAWASLNTYLGEDTIENFAHAQGFTSYTGGDYKTITPNDMAALLAKLGSGAIISSKHRGLLYSFMQHTDNETLIPAALNSDTTAYHKWGTLWGNLHDVAIISRDDEQYALVIYTKRNDETTSASQSEAIHKLTAAFVNYSIYSAHVTL